MMRNLLKELIEEKLVVSALLLGADLFFHLLLLRLSCFHHSLNRQKWYVHFVAAVASFVLLLVQFSSLQVFL